MKAGLSKAWNKGQRSLRIRATAMGHSNGHMLFTDCEFKGGKEDHLWANNKSLGMCPELKAGERVEFVASLSPCKLKDGSCHMRIEDIREVRKL